MLHEPGWSAGGGHENNTNVQNYIQPLCEQYGVTMVIAGHNHYYARALVNGVYHMTTGGGGAPLHWPESGHPNVQKTSFSHHFCEVNIRGNYLDFTAINISGAVIDEFSIDNSQTGIRDAESRISDRHIILLAPAPNPFNPGTDIQFILAASTEIELSIFDITGKKVNTLVRGLLPAGKHQYRWNGTDDRGGSLSSGSYIVFLRSKDETRSQKIVFLK
ncbi:MAG: T9SS type A sorting domain-containing protein [Calditrichae bacterium]|nr:T9SS type A sorting domain-containing protein [Calditrichia bacterium]